MRAWWRSSTCAPTTAPAPPPCSLRNTRPDGATATNAGRICICHGRKSKEATPPGRLPRRSTPALLALDHIPAERGVLLADLESFLILRALVPGVDRVEAVPGL